MGHAIDPPTSLKPPAPLAAHLNTSTLLPADCTASSAPPSSKRSMPTRSCPAACRLTPPMKRSTGSRAAMMPASPCCCCGSASDEDGLRGGFLPAASGAGAAPRAGRTTR